MGRFLAFLADALALVRALVEVADALGRARRPKAQTGIDGGQPDGTPAPVVLAEVDQPEGQSVRGPGGQAPEG